MARLNGVKVGTESQASTLRPIRTQRAIWDLLLNGNIIGWKGLIPGRSLIRTAPQASVYLNVSQFPVWMDWYFRWLDYRTDVKAVFFVHDLLPITYPEFFPPAEAARHKRRLEVIAARGRGIIVSSEDTRDGLTQHFRRTNKALPPVCVIPLPAPSTFTHPQDEAAFSIRRAYFVMVGTIEPRKNHLLLLNVWRELAEHLGDRTPTLLLVGAHGWDNENVVDMIERCRAIQPYIIEVRGLSTPALRRIMAGARAVLVPSLAEGYGLPVVEAAAAGAPVIISSTVRPPASAPATILDPLDGPGWRDAIIEHAFNVSSGGQRQRSQWRETEATQSWPLHIEHVEEFIQSL